MNAKTWVSLAIIGLMAAPAASLSAQRAQRRGPPGGHGPGIERMLQMRETLELSQDQIARLNELREEALTQRLERIEARMRARSEFEAGERTLAEMRGSEAAEREASAGLPEAMRERAEAILTEEQLEEFRSARRAAARSGRDQRSPRVGRRARGSDEGRAWSGPRPGGRPNPTGPGSRRPRGDG